MAVVTQVRDKLNNPWLIAIIVLLFLVGLARRFF